VPQTFWQFPGAVQHEPHAPRGPQPQADSAVILPANSHPGTVAPAAAVDSMGFPGRSCLSIPKD